MRIAAPITLVLLDLGASAQIGPGGVGNAANNRLWLSGDNSVVVVGAAVTNWNDHSGNNNNATSPSVPARPTLVGGALNGYPVLAFNGTTNELRIPDAGSLDLTQWDIFMVTAEGAPKNNNAWLSKGTNTQPNYALWSPATDALQLPIYDIFGLLSSPLTPAGTTGAAYSVLEYNNTVFLGLFPSRTVYKNGATVYNDVNLLQLPNTNNNQLYIGNVQGAVGWNLNGTLGEIIMYSTPVNSAQRIIINNYLAAKYGLALTTSDIYLQDLLANGNYDHEVAGIGRITGSNQQTDSRGTAVVQINNATGLGNNEFLIWGHDNGILGAWGSTDIPPGVQGRWFRVWRVNEVSPTGVAVDVGNVDITFDLTNQGPVVATDLRLLVDVNNNGVFADDAPIGGATAVGGNLYRFAAVNALVNNRRFTLATINISTTPLPIELLSFAAQVQHDRTVLLEWATANEHNNEYFVVERSANAEAWQSVVQLQSAGNSSTRTDYSTVDEHPLEHLSYYRLKQVDFGGSYTHSNTVAVNIGSTPSNLLLYPNPAHDVVDLVFTTTTDQREVRLYNSLGELVAAPTHTTDQGARMEVGALPEGGYIVVVVTDRAVLTQRLVLAR
ncbi:MAG: T9SS type A sorting domain-containing protein [Flavobacteriales bacterium]|nr:T9SS type A sorting domain-containing protein [Flavobacteriales bacterium]